MSIPIIAVVGATASNKTKLAIELAKKLDGEIISADSMQIYKYMDIGTAKPTESEQQQAKFHLISSYTPETIYNVGKFIIDASHAIQDVVKRKKVPILSGGSHLYVQSLCFGLRALPEIQPQIQNKVKQFHDQFGLQASYGLLQANLPSVANKLHPNDISRIHRALAVYWQTGKALDSFTQNLNPIQLSPFFIATQWTREELFNRINLRVDSMLEQGLLEETASLLEKYDKNLQPLRSIGYKQAIAYLTGETDYIHMQEDIKKQSRVYAKKQLIWLGKQKQVHFLSGQNSLSQKEQTLSSILEKAHCFLDY